jgi:hypothetical protein
MEKELKSTAIRALKNGKKRLRPFGDRSVELHFGFCFQQSVYGGGGSGRGPQAEGCKNRRHRRDRASSPESEKQNPYH